MRQSSMLILNRLRLPTQEAKDHILGTGSMPIRENFTQKNHEFSRQLSNVFSFHSAWVSAIITAPETIPSFKSFPKVAQKLCSPALHFIQAEHNHSGDIIHFLVLLVSCTLSLITENHIEKTKAVHVGEVEYALAPSSIPSSSSTFLIKSFYILRKRMMEHESHIWLIDSHTKRDGGANNLDVTRLPTRLLLNAILFVKTRMVAGCSYLIFGEELGGNIFTIPLT
mmetsp:Transcript_2866/g.5360  ORF Transcript_2866/g.5360 Transcript_2866/m.5360 type:complete len:225 (+) Transcript_2866:811-1485(+)